MLFLQYSSDFSLFFDKKERILQEHRRKLSFIVEQREARRWMTQDDRNTASRIGKARFPDNVPEQNDARQSTGHPG